MYAAINIIIARIAFSICCPVKVTGFVVINPCNLPNAIKLLVKVNVPINTLRVIVKIKNNVGSSAELSVLKNSAEATNAEAAPPNPLKIATS